MKGHFAALSFAVILTLAPSAALAQNDKPGSQDYPGLNRMPGVFISSYRYANFDTFDYTVQAGATRKKQTIEGKKWVISYSTAKGATPLSPVEPVRNYQNAVTAKGGEILLDNHYSNGYESTLRFHRGGAEVWLRINARNGEHELTIIERQAMEQKIVLDAQAMASAIADTGSVALYGIYFDTAKSEVRPDSQPAIEQIVQLLKDKPALNVGIVGHTDMTGDQAANIKLSQARAQSVIAELVRKGIAASRLTAFGAGPWAPIASNKTDDGRAKNRRVELVEIATR